MLNTRFKQWAAWGLSAEPRLIKTFTDGQNHSAALIEVTGKRYVLKVFKHSFEHAIATQRWAAQQQLSPTIIFAEGDLALMEYVESSGYGEHHLIPLAQALGRLHEVPAPVLNDFDLLAFCNQYLQSAGHKMQQWHQALLPGLAIFIDDPTPWCACHNDLVQENCLFQNDQAWFIDWEYAMRHNPWFDLAAIVLYFELNEPQARVFLDAYRTDWQSKFDTPIFYASQLALLWADLLWHIDKIGVGYREKNAHRFAKLESLATTLSISLPTRLS